MDILCINNINVYPNKYPPKGTIIKEIKITDMIIWITKSQDIYYYTADNHPVSKYTSKTATYMLGHLFFIFQNLILPILNNDFEVLIVTNFIMGCKDFLKKYSYNSFKESINDPIISHFHYQNYLPVETSPFELSYFKHNISELKTKQLKLKKDTKNALNNFKDDFNLMCNNILIQIDKKLVKNSKETVKEDNGTQVEIIKDSVEIQTDKIDKKNTGIQTEKIEEKKVEIIDKKKKNKDIYISFTETEYMNFMKEQNELVKQAEEKGYQRYRQNFRSFVTSENLPPNHIHSILLASTMKNVQSAILAYHTNMAITCFRMSLVEPCQGKLKLKIPLFVEFWREVILPNIDSFRLDVFKILKMEWNNMITLFMDSKVSVNDNLLNILFGHYGTIIVSNTWDLQSYIPTFYLVLFRACGSIPALVGIINFYEENRNDKELNKKTQLPTDFEALYAMQESSKIIFDNKTLQKMFESQGLII